MPKHYLRYLILSQVYKPEPGVPLPRGNTGCDFCARILGLLSKPPIYTGHIVLGKVSEFLANECPHVDWIRSMRSQNPPPTFISEVEYGKLDLVAHWYGTYLNLGFSLPSNATSNTECPVYEYTPKFKLAARNDQPGHVGTARLLDPEWVDLDIIRNWYSLCIDSHRSQCEQSPWMLGVRPAGPDWLIDVGQECIVPFHVETKDYASLSYTWGQTPTLKTTTSNLHSMRTPGALSTCTTLGKQIPNTIRDAMGVTKGIGIKYLWCDAMCCVQDDKEAMDRSLKKMHMIYANSILCIVARSGANANHGLRGIKGVSKPRRVNQVIVDLADGEKLCAKHKHSGCSWWDTPPADEPPYEKRAWTFQEFLFAKRRLIFDEKIVKWHCNCARWTEWEIGRESSIDESARPLAETWIKSRVPTLALLDSVISIYNNKVLSFPEDNLAAFCGIQSMLHRTYPGGLLFGHPELFFEITLAWDTSNFIKRHRSPGFSGDPTRDNLPSWSWMGWQGTPKFPIDFEFSPDCGGNNCGFLAPVTTWFSMDSPNATARRKINSRWHAHKYAAQCESGSLLDGWTRNTFKPPMGTKRWRLPKVVPQFSYAHTSAPGMRYGYPVPVLDSLMVQKINDQTQYLYCVTTRAFFYANTGKLYDVDGKLVEDMRVEDGMGNLVGVILCGGGGKHTHDVLGKSRVRLRIELVAIAKGWHSKLDDGSKKGTRKGNGVIHTFNRTGIPFNEEPALARYRAPLEEVYIDTYAPPSKRTDDEETEGDTEEHCYFVLWIKWLDGVAYRQGTGRVSADVWDRCKEMAPVELILG